MFCCKAYLIGLIRHFVYKRTCETCSAHTCPASTHHHQWQKLQFFLTYNYFCFQPSRRSTKPPPKVEERLQGRQPREGPPSSPTCCPFDALSLRVERVVDVSDPVEEALDLSRPSKVITVKEEPRDFSPVRTLSESERTRPTFSVANIMSKSPSLRRKSPAGVRSFADSSFYPVDSEKKNPEIGASGPKRWIVEPQGADNDQKQLDTGLCWVFGEPVVEEYIVFCAFDLGKRLLRMLKM